jgi:hypothetical protein
VAHLGCSETWQDSESKFAAKLEIKGKSKIIYKLKKSIQLFEGPHKRQLLEDEFASGA